MQHSKSGDMWVAAGTIFLDVLIWVVHSQGGSCTPLFRLKGHEGSIHRLVPQQLSQTWHSLHSHVLDNTPDGTYRSMLQEDVVQKLAFG